MPGTPGFDAVLTVEQALGVLLTTAIASKLAGPAGVQLHRLGNLEWLGFQRAEAPAWHDQVTATLCSHDLSARDQVQSGEHALIAEVKLAAVATGKAFTFARPTGPSRCLTA